MCILVFSFSIHSEKVDKNHQIDITIEWFDWLPKTYVNAFFFSLEKGLYGKLENRSCPPFFFFFQFLKFYYLLFIIGSVFMSKNILSTLFYKESLHVVRSRVHYKIVRVGDLENNQRVENLENNQREENN